MASAHTWWMGCERVLLSVSVNTQQTGPFPLVKQAWNNLKSDLNSSGLFSRVTLIFNRHTSARDLWLPLRSAISHAAKHRMQGMDWMLLVEDDAFVEFRRLKTFLHGFSPTVPRFFGACACKRSPGINLFSKAGLLLLERVLPKCAPIGPGWHDFDGSIVDPEGAGDVSVMSCLERANLTCSAALDAQGGMLISAMKSTPLLTLLRLLDHAATHRRFCSEWPCSKKSGCWSHDAFGFHAAALKQPTLITAFANRFLKGASTSQRVALASARSSLDGLGRTRPRRVASISARHSQHVEWTLTRKGH